MRKIARTYPQLGLIATKVELAPLYFAQALIWAAVQRQIDSAVWMLRGSVELKDALSPKLTGELDLDCYLVVSKTVSKCRLNVEFIQTLSAICDVQGWHLERRVFGHRIMVKSNPRLTLDVAVVRVSDFADEILDATGYPIANTDILNPPAERVNKLRHPLVRNAWLHLKAWAKVSLPWRSRPSSHVLRLIAAEHVQSKTPCDEGWASYVKWIGGLCDRLEWGQLHTNHSCSEQCSWPIDDTFGSFVAALRQYASNLRNISDQDYHQFLTAENQRNNPIRVFVSSRQREFEQLRTNLALKEKANFQPLLAEHFFPWNEKVSDGMAICETQINQADLFIGIYGSEYGLLSPNRGGSPIEEELTYATSILPNEAIMLFSLTNSRPEPRLIRMLQGKYAFSIQSMYEDIDSAVTQLHSNIVEAKSKKYDAIKQHGTP